MPAPFVIAGAGIAGLALAGALQRTGRDVLVVEERPAVTGGDGGLTLWPHALDALDRLGLGAGVRRAGRELPGGTVLSSSGRVLRRVDDDRLRAALGGPVLVVRRGVLVDLLRERLAPGTVLTGTAVVGHRHAPTGVVARLSDGSSVEGCALVGADGYRSLVARQLGPLAESYAGYPAWRGTAAVGGIGPVEVWGRRQVFGALPLDDHTTYWFATRPEPPGGTAGLARLRDAFAGWPAPVDRVLAASHDDAVSRVDVMDRALPRHWAEGRVVLVGDAAHPMRPHLGQGGCQALVDAAVLAGLLGEQDPATAFATFEAVRRRPAERVVRASRAAGRVAMHGAAHRLAGVVPERVLLAGLARTLRG